MYFIIILFCIYYCNCIMKLLSIMMIHDVSVTACEITQEQDGDAQAPCAVRGV